MTKLCIDFGSGYNPKAGYKTCDITTFPQLDFQYDGKDEIVGLREKSVDVFYLRNVVHHIPDLQRTFTTLKKYLKVGGKLVIIDCKKVIIRQMYFLTIYGIDLLAITTKSLSVNSIEITLTF